MTEFLYTDLLQRAARRLGQYNSSIATGGTTTTVVDTTIGIDTYKNDAFKNGVIAIIRTTDGLAPQGEIQRCSAYNNATRTFTVSTAFTVAPATGDTYMFLDDTYPYAMWPDLINDGLKSLGLLDLTDVATITMADNKTEYTGAVAWKHSRPFRIDVATYDDTDDYRWDTDVLFDYETKVAGTGPTILFSRQYSSTYPLVKVWYRDYHPTITDYDDKLREEIHIDLAAAAVAVEALNWTDDSSGGADENIERLLAKAENYLARMRQLHPIPKALPKAKTIDLVF